MFYFSELFYFKIVRTFKSSIFVFFCVPINLIYASMFVFLHCLPLCSQVLIFLFILIQGKFFIHNIN